MNDLEFPSRPGLSAGLKWAIGCFSALVLASILVCGGVAYLGSVAYKRVMAELDAFKLPFQELGYKTEAGQSIVVKNDLDEATLYQGQVVRIESTAHANVAIAAQAAEIHGTIEGDVDFLGQVVEIKEGAHITGDLRIKAAQVVIVRGRVDGEISGSYQVLDDKRATPASQAEPDASTEFSPSADNPTPSVD